MVLDTPAGPGIDGQQKASAGLASESVMVVLTRRHETDCGCNGGEPATISTNGRILAEISPTAQSINPTSSRIGGLEFDPAVNNRIRQMHGNCSRQVSSEQQAVLSR